MLELVRPTVDRREALLAAHDDWGPGLHEDGFGIGADDDLESEAGFEAWVDRLHSGQGQPWWIVDGEVVLGGIALRADAAPDVADHGHLGYGVRPSARGRGVASWAVEQVLQHAGSAGRHEVIAVCLDDNLASRRTIEHCGGRLVAVEAHDDAATTRRYRFALTPALTPSPARSDPVAEAFSALTAEGVRRCEIDRGGRKLRWLEAGAGETTVVLEAGAMSPVASFAAVFRDLAPDYRVVAHDRAGYGSSDFAPLSVDLQLGDLLAVLEAAGSERNILVGHSWGGLLVQLAAWQRPETIAGMVLVDPAHERYWLEFVTDDERSQMRRRPERGDSIDGPAGAEMCADATELARDIARSVGGGQHLQDLVQAACESYLATDEQLFVHLDEFPMIVSAAESVAERRSAGVWPDAPVIVLTATKGRPDYWTRVVTTVQDELVAEVGGRQVIVPDSGHYIQVDRPDLVSAAVRDVNRRTMDSWTS